MIKAIIFDMDGTLIDSEPFYQNVTLKCMQEHHIPVYAEDLLPLAGANSHQFSDFINPRIEGYLTREAFDKWHDKYFEENPIDFKKLLFHHVHETLSLLKEKSYRLVLASSSKKWEIEKVLNQCKLTDYFEFFLSGDMFKESKPNPEIYLVCIQKLGLSAKECIAIEDSEYGIAAAKGANLTCIAKKDSRFGFDQSSADYEVNDLLEIINILKEIKS